MENDDLPVNLILIQACANRGGTITGTCKLGGQKEVRMNGKSRQINEAK